MNTETKLFVAAKYLAYIGILLAVYLIWQQFFRPAFQPCYVNSFVNCNAIISGPVAKTLGIPTPLIGLTGYIVIFIASMIKQKKLLLGTALFGLVFCLYLAYVELFQLRVICPVCITCQVDMLSVFIIGVVLNRMKPQQQKKK
jgi:uncharacterized membrane protein